jgi:hypothetical protein
MSLLKWDYIWTYFLKACMQKNVESPLSVGNSSFTKYWYLLGYFCAVLLASFSYCTAKTKGYLADSNHALCGFKALPYTVL